MRWNPTNLAGGGGSYEAIFTSLFILLALFEESLRHFDGLDCCEWIRK